MTVDDRRQVVILGFPGYRELHLWYPLLRMREEDIKVTLAAPDDIPECQGSLGYPLIPETPVSAVDPARIAALVVPGGAAVAATDTALARLVAAAHQGGATVAAVADGSALLAAAGLPVDATPTQDQEVTEHDRVVLASDSDALPALVRRLVQIAGPR
jgi:putative intracellular protease/amidase